MEHGWIEHNSVYEEILRVPLVLHAPGREPGRVGATVRLVDLMPTLLEMVGLPVPAHLHGASLLPILEGRERGQRPVLAQWRERGALALRVDDWKLVRMGGRRELYNVAEDPAEELNVRTGFPSHYARLDRSLRIALARSRGIWELVAAGRPVSPDVETLRQLEALGYVEGAPD
jgi:arylsulfatase A-like enzyme